MFRRNRSEAVKKLKTPEILAPKCLITKKCFLRFGDFFNFFTASQSRRVGRVCPQRAGPRARKYGGALRTDAPYPPLLLITVTAARAPIDFPVAAYSESDRGAGRACPAKIRSAAGRAHTRPNMAAWPRPVGHSA